MLSKGPTIHRESMALGSGSSESTVEPGDQSLLGPLTRAYGRDSLRAWWGPPRSWYYSTLYYGMDFDSMVGP